MNNRYFRRHRDELPEFLYDDDPAIEENIASIDDIEKYKEDILKSVQKRGYPSDSEKKHLVEREAHRLQTVMQRIGLTIEIPSNNSVILRRRKTAIINLLKKWTNPNTDLISWEESLVDFEMIPQRTDYDGLDSDERTTLAAALWILDDLRRNQKMYDAFHYLPDDYDEVLDIDIPLNFYDPSYDDDLICSVISVIYNRDRRDIAGDGIIGAYCNTVTAQGKKYETADRQNFNGMYALLDENRIAAAKEHFKEKQSEVLRIYMDCQAELDREMRMVVSEGVHQISVLSVSGEDDIDRFRDAVTKLSEIEERRRDIELHIADFLTMPSKDLRERLGKGSLVRKFKGFTINDPYEICFGLLALLEDGDDAPWLLQSGYCVMKAAANLLPWHDSPFEDVSDNEWDDHILTINYNNWLEKQTDEAVDYYHEMYGGRNLSQIIYGLTGGVIPRNMHPFEDNRLSLKESGMSEALADKVIDHAEMLFLSQFQAGAGNLSRREWGISVADEPTGEPITEEPEVDVDHLTAELKRRGDEIKGLKKALSETRKQAEKDKARAEKELYTLRQEHRELADLRELVFNQDNELQGDPTDESIEYPYETKKRTVVFGGHETWLKAFKPKFSNVKFIDALHYVFSPDIIRNADVVWIQNNRISHSQYYAVVNLARQNGIQVRYFPYASADKCAEILVKEDNKA